MRKATNPKISAFDEGIIEWHITEDGELDYTIYEAGDGGRLEIDDEADIMNILEELVNG